MSQKHRESSRNLIDEDVDDLEFRINPKFAVKYQEKKKKEELSTLKDKYKEKLAKRGVAVGTTTKNRGDSAHADEDIGSGDESESDSEADVIEDEDGALVTPGVEAQILKTLAEIKGRDPKVYDPNTKFFSPEELAKTEAEWRTKREQSRQEKPLRLKDFHRQKLLSGAHLEDDQQSDAEEESNVKAKTFDEEQEEVLGEFLAAAKTIDEDEEGDAEVDMFRVRPKTDAELAKEDIEYRSFLLENLSNNANARESMSEWFQAGEGGRGQAASTEERFLIEYVLNRGWVEKDRRALPSYDEIIKEDEEDAIAVDQMEAFEEHYNFRFEQPGGDKVTTYARTIEGSMRRDDNKRKEERAARQARKKEEKERQREELKRLKNLKRAELEKKLQKIRQVAGNNDIEVDLESDFDPEAHDAKMSHYFDDGYYGMEEAKEKPTWTASEDEDGAKGEDADLAPIGVHTAKVVERATKSVKRLISSKASLETAKSVKADSKAVADRAGKALAKYLDEYYKLDYEDKIGDLACRFKYERVAPTTFGLRINDIITADDTELNTHVSLKKLAPYRAADQMQADEARLANKKRIYKFYNLLERRMNGEPIPSLHKKQKNCPQ